MSAIDHADSAKRKPASKNPAKQVFVMPWENYIVLQAGCSNQMLTPADARRVAAVLNDMADMLEDETI